MAADPGIVVVLTTLPDRRAAVELATALVSERIAACANVLAECTSIYRWQGKVEKAFEVPILIKTSVDQYPKLEAAIRARHPYEVPEIVAFPVAAGLPAYLDWVEAETAAGESA